MFERLFLGTVLWIVFSGCTDQASEQPSLTVFCGAANKPAMEEIGALFEKERGIEVNLIFGGSGTMLSQIELSKSGEIYLPGSPDFIAAAERKKLIHPESDRIVAYLVPAIITPKGNPAGIRSLADLARPGVKIAIGNPETVCLGFYGVELLEAAGLLEPVLENVVTFGGSCAKLANLAALSQVDAVIGWRVVHYWNPEKLDLVLIAPDQLPRISYVPISIPVYTRDRALSESFIEFVLSEQGKNAYEKHGYLTDVEEAGRFGPGATVGGEYNLPDDFFERLTNLWDDS